MTAVRKTPTGRGRNVSAEEIRDIAQEAMRRQFEHLRKRGKAQASTPEEFYGFGPGDVIAVYAHKHGEGNGMWLRLKDGRVVDYLGKPSQPGAEWYETPTH
jgi:hypothetical protein